jgi:hypothetical protein
MFTNSTREETWSYGTHGGLHQRDGTVRDGGVDAAGQLGGVDEAIREVD